jgi:hypothetical protein
MSGTHVHRPYEGYSKEPYRISAEDITGENQDDSGEENRDFHGRAQSQDVVNAGPSTERSHRKPHPNAGKRREPVTIKFKAEVDPSFFERAPKPRGAKSNTGELIEQAVSQLEPRYGHFEITGVKASTIRQYADKWRKATGRQNWRFVYDDGVNEQGQAIGIVARLA